MRHQAHAPKDHVISIADLDDGYCFMPAREAVTDRREKLCAAICYGTQHTAYNCDNVCKAMCGSDGSCAYCATIADAIEEVMKHVD